MLLEAGVRQLVLQGVRAVANLEQPGAREEGQEGDDHDRHARGEYACMRHRVGDPKHSGTEHKVDGVAVDHNRRGKRLHDVDRARVVLVASPRRPARGNSNAMQNSVLRNAMWSAIVM